MAVDQRRLRERARVGVRESAALDFKSTFDISSAESWCEVIKDIVAFANSGGGIVVFGADDQGNPCGADPSPILAYDIADITNRIAKYTGYQFAEIEIIEVARGNNKHAAFLVGDTDVPIPFIKPGTYDAGGGKQKTAFSQGTVYFRHGAKSEPGNRDDFLKWRDRAVAKVRGEWLSGIRKVVEAPEGHTVTVLPVGEIGQAGATITARISSDPKAQSFIPRNAEEIWPYRQKNLLDILNKELNPPKRITSHDIQCLNRKIDVLKAHPEFAYRSHPIASPQYSQHYADWIVREARRDPAFFEICRQEQRAQRAAK